jgi:hypothetical protein
MALGASPQRYSHRCARAHLNRQPRADDAGDGAQPRSDSAVLRPETFALAAIPNDGQARVVEENVAPSLPERPEVGQSHFRRRALWMSDLVGAASTPCVPLAVVVGGGVMARESRG